MEVNLIKLRYHCKKRKILRVIIATISFVPSGNKIITFRLTLNLNFDKKRKVYKSQEVDLFCIILSKANGQRLNIFTSFP